MIDVVKGKRNVTLTNLDIYDGSTSNDVYASDSTSERLDKHNAVRIFDYGFTALESS